MSSPTTKRIPAPELQAFARFLQNWVNQAYAGNQTAAGKALKITQGHISSMLRGERGPGLNTLIRLREKTGQTIDSMLGLSSLNGEQELIERLRATFELEVARARKETQQAVTALLDEQAKQHQVRPHRKFGQPKFATEKK